VRKPGLCKARAGELGLEALEIVFAIAGGKDQRCELSSTITCRHHYGSRSAAQAGTYKQAFCSTNHPCSVPLPAQKIKKIIRKLTMGPHENNNVKRPGH
jgi:hypothetical protein